MSKRLVMLLMLLFSTLPVVIHAAQANTEFCDSGVGQPTACRLYRVADPGVGEPMAWALMVTSFETEREAVKRYTSIEQSSARNRTHYQLADGPADITYFAVNQESGDGLLVTGLFATQDNWLVTILAVDSEDLNESLMSEVLGLVVDGLPPGGEASMEVLPSADEMPGKKLSTEDDWRDLNVLPDGTPVTGTPVAHSPVRWRHFGSL